MIKECLDANVLLQQKRLAIQSFGNVSARIDAGHFVIKPSGVDLTTVREADFPIIEIDTGVQVDGALKPSTDTPTHLLLYQKFPEIGGIAHCHSKYATAWAQAARPIPILGTTHADYWANDIPLTRELNDSEVLDAYEHNTGVAIAELLQTLKGNALEVPGVLVRNHGPIAWGQSAEDALRHAELLEFIAELAVTTLSLNPDAGISKVLVDKHFSRKHGADSYYGQ